MPATAYLRLGITLMTLGAALAFCGLWSAFHDSGRILPGVSVAGVDVGMMTHDEAVSALMAAWPPNRTITLWAGGHPLQVMQAELGLELDAESLAAEAQAVGRYGNFWDALKAALGGFAIPPRAVLDADRARRTLEAISALASTPPDEAGIRITGTSVETTLPSPGAALDVEATLSRLESAPDQVLASGELYLVMRPWQPTVEDSEQVAGLAEELLSAPFLLTAYDPFPDETLWWEIQPEELAPMIRTRIDDSGPEPQLRLGIDHEAAMEFLGRLNSELGHLRAIDVDAAVSAWDEAIAAGEHTAELPVIHPPYTYVVSQGETLAAVARATGVPLYWIQQVNPGLDWSSMHPGDTVLIPSRDMLVPLPVVRGKRIVISLSDQRMQVYQDGELLWDWPVSTGIESSPTSPGVFQVQTHENPAYAAAWDLWMPHFLGIYRAGPGTMNGIHGLPTLSNGQMLWAGLLGSPASYGCIILSLENAETLYNWAENGVIVEIRQ